MEWRRFVADYEQDDPLVTSFAKVSGCLMVCAMGSVRSEAELHR
ncbi:hypothetical protein [Kingella oralis]|jgi:hypothetical protein|uniref:Uncharacterized protein n=1 Tax=Kingella oralis ATCC 51147 TaxID=629741 RepID=C4GH14_9NEIS|nr:hypothetical protein [Kingella oralis]EEP69519.1 hypothetical protein GCWU000324_01433 [Kingella oralis ATCC 51147]